VNIFGSETDEERREDKEEGERRQREKLL